MQEEFGSFDRYIWQFLGGRPRVNAWRLGEKVPARTPESEHHGEKVWRRMYGLASSRLPTICYAFMPS